MKVGTKFKAGGSESFAYEPHLLLELSLERSRNRPRYGHLTALLAKAITEQQAEIRELKLQIEKMARLNDAPATGGTGTN